MPPQSFYLSIMRQQALKYSITTDINSVNMHEFQMKTKVSAWTFKSDPQIWERILWKIKSCFLKKRLWENACVSELPNNSMPMFTVRVAGNMWIMGIIMKPHRKIPCVLLEAFRHWMVIIETACENQKFPQSKPLTPDWTTHTWESNKKGEL